MDQTKINVGLSVLGFSALLWASGIVPAIIPQSVPAANKIGNSTKFQLGTGSPTSGNCASYDASGNIQDNGAPCGTGSAAFGSITTGTNTTATMTCGTGCTIAASGAGVINATNVGAASAFVLIEQHTAANSAELDFTTCITSTYDTYEIMFLNVLPATNATGFNWQVSTDGGATYDGGTNYNTVGRFFFSGGSGDVITSNGTAFTLLTANLSNTGIGFSGNFRLYNPLSGAHATVLTGHSQSKDSSVNLPLEIIWGLQYNPSTAVNAFRVLMLSGNITSGTVRCYGLAK